jgi:hypothetical protein
MYRPIDPKVDCVFKTLFGSDAARDLLNRTGSKPRRTVG